MRRGFTLVEILITMVIVLITIQIASVMVSNYIKSYQITRRNIENLYAVSYVSFLFDVIESELLNAGSGGELLKELHKPDGSKYTQITDHLWLIDSIDVVESDEKLEFYISYVTTYKNILIRNSDGTYSPLYHGELGEFEWAIVKNKFSPTAEGYKTRLVKLMVSKIGGSGSYPGSVSPEDKFELKEVDLNDRVIDLTENDVYVYPIAMNKVPTGYQRKVFRQTKVVFEKDEGRVYIERTFPLIDEANNSYRIDILNNVSDFDIFALYYENGMKEQRLVALKDMPYFDQKSIVALKFVVKWRSPQKMHDRDFEVEKIRVISLVPNM